MKKIIRIFLLAYVGFLHAEPLRYVLGPESVLLESGQNAPHTAFPHAAADGRGNLWMVYRTAGAHAGSPGALHLIKYRLSDMAPLLRKEIYSHDRLDPRDPTIAFDEGIVLVSFFQYNYTFNMVRQFVLTLESDEARPVGPPRMLSNQTVLNHSSSSPLLRHGDGWILPVYYVGNFFSAGTDVGYFSTGRFGSGPDTGNSSVTAELTTIATGTAFRSFFLEPSIAAAGNRWISLFRSSPVSSGPGGLAAMYLSESSDGGLSWTPPRETPFIGHHPRLTIDSKGTVWAGFRDLTAYDASTYNAKITLWRLDDDDGNGWYDPERTVTIFETSTPDPGNWDCGYPSWIRLGDDTFRAVYYYAEKGKFRIAERLVTLK